VAVSGSTILVSMQDYPAIASYDGGRTWNYIAVIPEGGEIRFHPANPLYAYYFGGNGFMYSTDGGRTFQAATVAGTGMQYQYTQAIAFDPAVASTLYVVGMDGIYESFDSGRTFSRTNWALPSSPTIVAVDLSDSQTIFVGDAGGSLSVSHDKGATWSKSDFGRIVSGPLSIAIDPSNSKNVLVGTLRMVCTQPRQRRVCEYGWRQDIRAGQHGDRPSPRLERNDLRLERND
jgi:photosystem II stability/assembly factor-like uncharacterized protein